MPAIGIDLGRTNCRAAVLCDGKVEVIADEHGNSAVPCCVTFTDSGKVIGEQSSKQISTNPKNTVFDVRRLIGRRYDDPVLQSDMKRWNFKVKNTENKPRIQVEYKRQNRSYVPEKISGMVLMHVKSLAEKFMGDEMQSAVITVPAYFNDEQRRATKDAAEIAGFGDPTIIVTEPTAAAIAYGLHRKSEKKRNVLVYYMGSTSSDVTIMTIEDELFDIKSTAGDDIGGRVFTDRLLAHFAEEIREKHGVDVTKNDKSKKRLITECEKAKRLLSAKEIASIEVMSLGEGVNFKSRITRDGFEKLNEDLFQDKMATLKRALQDAEMSKDKIDDVILAGGSTRIPAIRKMLEKYFKPEKIYKDLNPEEVIAHGAAIHAARLSDYIPKKIWSPEKVEELPAETSKSNITSKSSKESTFKKSPTSSADTIEKQKPSSSTTPKQKPKETIRREDSEVESQKKQEKHIMISYEWNDQTLAKQVKENLEKLGYPVWIDIERASGSLIEAMAKGVENASAVVMFVSKNYKESKSCQKEAGYADSMDIPLIPLVVEQGYKADGWLGILANQNLHVDFSDEDCFETEFEKLVKEIESLKIQE